MFYFTKYPIPAAVFPTQKQIKNTYQNYTYFWTP